MIANELVNDCPLCGKSYQRIFNNHSESSIDLTYRVCLYCGLVFMSPRFSEATLRKYYRSTYREMHSGSAEPTVKDFEEQRARADHLVEFTGEIASQVATHLDIGCSTGELLQAFRRKNPGIVSFGIEPGEGHRGYVLTNSEILIYESLEELSKAKVSSFNFISMSHVLEHLLDPVGYLSYLRENLLTKESHLLIEVPNIYAHTSYEMAHPICFSPRTLTITLEQSGFQIIRTRLHGFPRSNNPNNQRYITVLAKPSGKSASPVPKGEFYLMTKLRRMKGLSGKTWFQLAWSGTRHPARALGLLKQHIGK